MGNNRLYHATKAPWLRHRSANGEMTHGRSPFPRHYPLPLYSLFLCLALYIGGLAPAAAAPPAEWMEAGAGWFRIGNFEKALAHWQHAAAGYQATGNLEGQTLALVQAAEAHLALGQYPRAFDKLRHALALAEQTDNPSLVAAVTGSLGNTYLLAGRVKEAKQTLESSVEIATKAGNLAIAASTLNNLGNLLASHGSLDEAAAINVNSCGPIASSVNIGAIIPFPSSSRLSTKNRTSPPVPRPKAIAPTVASRSSKLDARIVMSPASPAPEML